MNFQINKLYLLSNKYLNNINYFYLKEKNYIKSSNPINRIFKSYLSNHDDLRLLNNFYFDNIDTEKILINVNVKLDTAGDTYNYILNNDSNMPYILNKSDLYFIDNQFLSIDKFYILNLNTYISLNSEILSTNTILYNKLKVTSKKFDKIKLFKTGPEIISKINLLNNIKLYMIINYLKTWSEWSLLSAYNIKDFGNILNKGNIVYNNNNILQDNTSDIYFHL